MLDARIKGIIDPTIGHIGKSLHAFGVTANQITTLGLIIGGVAGLFIAYELYLWGLLLIGLSRLMDGLDGAVARAGRKKPI